MRTKILRRLDGTDFRSPPRLRKVTLIKVGKTKTTRRVVSQNHPDVLKRKRLYIDQIYTSAYGRKAYESEALSLLNNDWEVLKILANVAPARMQEPCSSKKEVNHE